MESMVDLETGAARQLRLPATGRRPRRRRSAATRRSSTRSSTSTRCSTSATAPTNDVPLTELEKDLKKADSTPNYSYISPNLCNAGVAGQCPVGAPDGAASADAFLASWVPKILASPAYKQDGLLIVTFGAGQPGADRPGDGSRRDPDRRPAESRRAAALAVRHARLHRRRRLRPLLAAALDRGPLRPRPPGQGRRRQGEVLRAGAAGRKRRRLANRAADFFPTRVGQRSAASRPGGGSGRLGA